MRPAALRRKWWRSRALCSARARGPFPGPSPVTRCIRLAVLAGRCPVMRHYRTRVFLFPAALRSAGAPLPPPGRVLAALRRDLQRNAGATLNAAGRKERARRGRERLRGLARRASSEPRAAQGQIAVGARFARALSRWQCACVHSAKPASLVLGRLRGHAPASAEYDEGTGESRASGALRAPPRGRRPVRLREGGRALPCQGRCRPGAWRERARASGRSTEPPRRADVREHGRGARAVPRL